MPIPTDPDEKWMRMAWNEAQKGIGKTHPNPAVGAVIVKNGILLAKGWHRAAGRPHAEIEALRALQSPTLAHGATIYITLEPCSTHGRTPPCTQALIDAGIARVVYGAQDPNPNHAGRANPIFENAGITVQSSLLAADCAALNLAWNKWIRTGTPYVITKAGMSLDGRIGSHPARRWITSEAARKDAMKIRAASGAILVGAETVRTDNPSLTVRGRRVKEQPLRIVWSRTGNIDPACHLLADAHKDRTLIFKNQSLPHVLKELGHRGVQQVLIEGGGRTLAEAFEHQLVDHVVLYIAPVLLGGPTPTISGTGISRNEDAIRLSNPNYTLIGGDIRLESDVQYTQIGDCGVRIR
jgi:diaminohydroxyphosphoribosylaminopyrimidine deaminase/5-amino-6-(5-phosphoribosylamino)uracil reductase